VVCGEKGFEILTTEITEEHNGVIPKPAFLGGAGDVPCNPCPGDPSLR
jgi:hypothetical protein